MNNTFSSVMFFSDNGKSSAYESSISKIINKTQEMTTKELQMPFEEKQRSESKSKRGNKSHKRDASSEEYK